MTKKLNCILLVDDDNDCNFFHERLLNKLSCTEKISIAHNGEEAINYLKINSNNNNNNPELILLDINMPKINGWEFLDLFEKDNTIKKDKTILLMLTSSLNPDDYSRAKNYNCVKGFYSKYLDEKSINEIFVQYYPDYI